MAATRWFSTLGARLHDNPLGLPKSRHVGPPKPIVGFPNRFPIPGVEQIIAVASGKGGVGKSTTAVNLALALSRQKKSVGILDADLFGPSVPRMMGVSSKPEINERGLMRPVHNYGIGVMSMGLIVEENSAVVWRGLMVTKALEQLLRQVEWGNLDVLVIDMPPGTGDTQLTITQYIPLSGAVIVSTPQEVALGAVRRGVDMFHKVNVPILGVVENMSYYVCGHCNEKTYLFGEGGVKRTAGELNIPVLGEVPIEPLLSSAGDQGKPIVLSYPDSVSGVAFMTIAATVLQRLDHLKTMKIKNATTS